MSENLTTVAEIIEKLGGPSAAGKLVGRSVQSAVNWRNSGRLPSDTFLIFQAELRDRGFTAPPSIWGIRQPESAS